MVQASSRILKHSAAIGSCLAIALCAGYVTKSLALGARESRAQAATVANSASDVSPIFGITIPPGYRDWKLIAVDRLVTGKTNQLRAQLGNEIAIKAYKEGTLPFPDGAIIAGVHWTRVPSEDNRKVLATEFPDAQSFVIGSAVNVQFMVKDSKKYAATGGWGFADFKDGKSADEAALKTCFPCHVPAKANDYVFAKYAPTP